MRACGRRLTIEDGKPGRQCDLHMIEGYHRIPCGGFRHGDEGVAVLVLLVEIHDPLNWKVSGCEDA